MKKRLFFKMLLVSAVVFSITACDDSDQRSQSDQVTRVVKISSVVAATHPSTIALKEVFKPIIESKTNGRYQIDVYDSGQLGDEKQSFDYTRQGIIDMSVLGTVMWSEVPKMSVPDFPFLFKDVAHARKIYQGEVGKDIADSFESSQPIKFLAWLPNGARVFSSSKSLSNPDQFKGQKMRMPNNPIHVKVAELLGANVAIMGLGEVFTALEQGVVDGQDNPMSTFVQQGFYSVNKNIYETNHMISSLELLSNAKFWKGLSDDDKAIFLEAAKAASDKSWDLYQESIDADKKFLAEKGVVVVTPTDTDKTQLVEKMQPLYDDLYEKYDWAEALVERIRNTN
ncbi:tripartite ATP-independent transporter solute receptor, DctP family [Pasteurella testudinis DSM 23072]|uniref:Tripartite ATP-independent transporter solute receptor, DctP family n=1 Tax=Pasteurella testudinis DSM 23072 TaxID=1122938 RepID=A0A1W1V847_9PAST|nr:TRAP transporter substrate-binding protein [Pasteurella testudinis]SMB89647.1 tripartite ATP-independent transporter solute receptor, DctP family [Pasteurella testudinis DSM 23072]SUB52049.1 TRAP-T family tripartite ATP-independent periplasmic transporter, binding protein [Pasteurella testudinis]